MLTSNQDCLMPPCHDVHGNCIIATIAAKASSRRRKLLLAPNWTPIDQAHQTSNLRLCWRSNCAHPLICTSYLSRCNQFSAMAEAIRLANSVVFLLRISASRRPSWPIVALPADPDFTTKWLTIVIVTLTVLIFLEIVVIMIMLCCKQRRRVRTKAMDTYKPAAAPTGAAHKPTLKLQL